LDHTRRFGGIVRTVLNNTSTVLVQLQLLANCIRSTPEYVYTMIAQRGSVTHSDDRSSWKGFWSFGREVTHPDGHKCMPFEYTLQMGATRKMEQSTQACIDEEKATNEGEKAESPQITARRDEEPSLTEKNQTSPDMSSNSATSKSAETITGEARNIATDTEARTTKEALLGQWKGYFETAATRKEDPNVRIEETFSITSTYAVEGSNLRRVVGKGANVYGDFSIEGSYCEDESVLSVRKEYAQPPDTKHTTNRSSKIRTNAAGTPANRPARKRQMSWKRRAADEEEPSRVARRHSHGKKHRADGEHGAPVLTISTGLCSTGASTTKPSTPRAPPTSPRLALRRHRGVVVAASGDNIIQLPPVGDLSKSRWLSSNYLYYVRPEASEETLTSEKAANVQPKYVCYEGEMMGSLRHGRGICLFNNGLLYQGDWISDREHGRGVIFSADRKFKIYEGEFERGRIHGVGTYYNYQDMVDSPHSDAILSEPTSRYEGEFKEGLRHGDGTYYLSDGSVYKGSFQNDLFGGRGVLTWPDGSVYDGEWKTGKRHGMGTLKVADGFEYDGMWAGNSMEGRGQATYPGGQQYIGLFSRGKRDGRGTITFVNGAVYEGRFKDDAIDGQGTMKMSRATSVPNSLQSNQSSEHRNDFMIPLSFQSDMTHIHRRAGFL